MDGAPERFWPGENGQRQERGVGWETVVVERRISPLRGSQRTCDRLWSKMTVLCFDGKGTGNGKGNSKSGGLGVADGLDPTHRRVRGGWGTRAVLAGGERAKARARCWLEDGGGRKRMSPLLRSQNTFVGFDR
jgi:hypothetical protein